MDFKSWMKKIDDLLIDMCMVGVYDLPDYAYRDAFDAGASPEEVAVEVLEYAGGGDLVPEEF